MAADVTVAVSPTPLVAEPLLLKHLWWWWVCGVCGLAAPATTPFIKLLTGEEDEEEDVTVPGDMRMPFDVTEWLAEVATPKCWWNYCCWWWWCMWKGHTEATSTPEVVMPLLAAAVSGVGPPVAPEERLVDSRPFVVEALLLTMGAVNRLMSWLLMLLLIDAVLLFTDRDAGTPSTVLAPLGPPTPTVTW